MGRGETVSTKKKKEMQRRGRREVEKKEEKKEKNIQYAHRGSHGGRVHH